MKQGMNGLMTIMFPQFQSLLNLREDLLEAKRQKDVANEKSRIGSIFGMVYFRNNSFKLRYLDMITISNLSI